MVIVSEARQSSCVDALHFMYRSKDVLALRNEKRKSVYATWEARKAYASYRYMYEKKRESGEIKLICDYIFRKKNNKKTKSV